MKQNIFMFFLALIILMSCTQGSNNTQTTSTQTTPAEEKRYISCGGSIHEMLKNINNWEYTYSSSTANLSVYMLNNSIGLTEGSIQYANNTSTSISFPFTNSTTYKETMTSAHIPAYVPFSIISVPTSGTIKFIFDETNMKLSVQ
jgi:hypothetical protein